MPSPVSVNCDARHTIATGNLKIDAKRVDSKTYFECINWLCFPPNLREENSSRIKKGKNAVKPEEIDQSIYGRCVDSTPVPELVDGDLMLVHRSGRPVERLFKET
ncbi:hypothetical protein TNCV_3649911 [Trichonephila clavipes]|nr:hypothetical protein TNCV_3649911 [Trichonephila clavipes]